MYKMKKIKVFLGMVGIGALISLSVFAFTDKIQFTKNGSSQSEDVNKDNIEVAADVDKDNSSAGADVNNSIEEKQSDKNIQANEFISGGVESGTPESESNIEVGVRMVYQEGFYYEPIPEAIKQKITGVSYKENDMIDYDDLRYVTVKYVDFFGKDQIGNLIVNVQVADDVLGIFYDLYSAGYQIEKIRLVDEYGADDDLSMADNNTSAFNYRVIDGTDTLSDHGKGVAIDINPLYNPYVRTGFGDRDVLPVNGTTYANRQVDFEHKIVAGDVCYNAFVSRGWKWGGDWQMPIDYQHFYKEIM